MKELKQRVEQKVQNGLGPDIFKNDKGAIDLSSIMVGIIVIGLIGGVIATTVFAIIPWAQDHAAKQQLSSITSAEDAFMGLTSAKYPPANVSGKVRSYANSDELEAADLLAQGKTYCVMATPDGKNYNAYSQSASGKVFTSTNSKTAPTHYTGVVPAECASIGQSYENSYVDPTPKRTVLTYVCDATTTGVIPMNTNVTGRETWSDGVTRNYTGVATPTAKTLNAGVTYTMTFEGTYTSFGKWSATPSPLSKCLTAVNHWGSDTGTINAEYAFYGATKLTDVPRHFPSAVTNMYGMFTGAKAFNDPDVVAWNVSNVTVMGAMFNGAESFNQSIGNWNVGKVTTMDAMFFGAKAFNKPLNNWNVSNVTNMSWMFEGASSFNQPLNKWNIAKVTTIAYMFSGATEFNGDITNWNTTNVTAMESAFAWTAKFDQPLNNWNTSKVTNMAYMFESASVFNQPLDFWNVSKVTNMSGMFSAASKFNQPIGNWDVTAVTSVSGMFDKASVFNQPLNAWNVSNVTNFSWLFSEAHAFNQPLSSWNTAKATTMQGTFYNARVFNQPISNWNTTNVTNMSEMFSNAFAFNQPINLWTVSNVTNMSYMFYDAYAFNQPLNNWNTGKVTNMSYMFYDTTIFSQNLSGWNTAALTNGTFFAPAVNFPSNYKPTGTTLY